MPRILILFKGTGSVDALFERLGWEVVSLDILKKFNPTHQCDIMDFVYTQYPRGHFDIIWASPECKVYSKLQRTNVGVGRKYKDKEELERVRQENSKYVYQVLKMLWYFDPDEYYIENPWDSAMKDLEWMLPLRSYRFDYCQFDFPYKKPTRIWTNRRDLEDRKCTCTGAHPFRLGIKSKSLIKNENQGSDPTNTKLRYRIPQGLLTYLFQHKM